MAEEPAEVEFRKGIKELPAQLINGVQTIFTEVDFATPADVSAGAAVDKPVNPAQAKEIALANAGTSLAEGATVKSITISGATKELGFNFAPAISLGVVTLSLTNGTFQYATISANLTLNLPTLPAGSQPTALTILVALSATATLTVAGRNTAYVWLGETPILPTASGTQIWLFCMWNPIKARWSVSATSESSTVVPAPESMTLTPGDGNVAVEIVRHESGQPVTQYQKDTGAWTSVPAGATFTLTAANGTPTTIRSRHGNGAGDFSSALEATVTPTAKTIAIITGDVAAMTNTYFTDWHAYVASLGWTVTTLNASTSTSGTGSLDFTPYKAVAFDAAMHGASGNIPTNLNKPMIVYDFAVPPSLGMTSLSATLTDTNDVKVVDALHPIWADIPGVTVDALIRIWSTGASTIQCPLITDLAPGCKVIAKHPTAAPERAVIYELPAGAQQITTGASTGGVATAPNRRIAGPFEHNLARYWNATGKTLVKNALDICAQMPSVTVP